MMDDNVVIILQVQFQWMNLVCYFPFEQGYWRKMVRFQGMQLSNQLVPIQHVGIQKT